MCLDFHPNTFMLEKMEVNSDIGIRPVLNTPTDNESERGENKTIFPCRLYLNV